MPIQVGRYEIIRELALDATGRVLLARNEERKCHVTIRVLDAVASAEAQVRVSAAAAGRRVAMALEELAHPDLATVLDCIEIDGCTALVAERFEGEPLASFCRLESLLAIDDAVELVAKAAEALAAAEDAGIVHGQVRPSNLLRVGRRSVKILDFALAPALLAAGVQETVLERGAGYLPPERFRGGNSSGRGDQFSLGAVLFELLGGEPAFGGQEASSVVYRILHEPPRDPDRLPRPIPQALRHPLFRALAKQPEQRFASGLDFAAALRDALAGVRDEERLTAVAAVGRTETTRESVLAKASAVSAIRPARSRSRWPWVAGAAALALVGGAWIFRDRIGMGPGAREIWWEARVRVEPPEADLTLDGQPLEGGPADVVRFGSGAPFGLLTATLGCRSIEHRLQPSDAATEIVLELPPSRLDWQVEPGVPGARVAVNDRAAGQAPVALALDLCRYNRIVVEAPGYLPAALDIPAGVTLPEARARLSSLTLERIPVGAVVLPELAGLKLVWYVDGERAGESGRDFELRQGRHTLRFKNEYHWVDGTLEVDVVAGRTTRPELEGVDLANLTVQAFPPNAKVFLRRPGEGWRYLDETPATRRVAAGAYEIKVELVTTGQSELREVTLNPGENMPVRVSFGSL